MSKPLPLAGGMDTLILVCLAQIEIERRNRRKAARSLPLIRQAFDLDRQIEEDRTLCLTPYPSASKCTINSFNRMA